LAGLGLPGGYYTYEMLAVQQNIEGPHAGG
jgi:hypothetical protein